MLEDQAPAPRSWSSWVHGLLFLWVVVVPHPHSTSQWVPTLYVKKPSHRLRHFELEAPASGRQIRLGEHIE